MTVRVRDAVVVGGGPAGSTCARALRAAGLDVLVIDKQHFPRDKTCAGWITPQVVATLQLDVEEYRATRVMQPITGFRTARMGAREVETRYDAEVSYGIRRFEFDHYLLQRCGAELALGTPLRTLERSSDGWLVNGEIATPLVIGAGGHFCPVARSLGADLGRAERVVAAQEIEFEMDARQRAACTVDGRTPELYFCADLKGYGWCFRKGDFLNVGLGREDNHHLGEHVQAFCRALVDAGRIPADLPVRFHGHAYLLYEHAPRPLYADGALLIGDAAGLAYTQSGEGIRPAIESGLMAARTVIDAQGDYRAERLRGYADGIAARYGRRDGAQASHPLVPQRVREALGGRLLATRWFTRHVVLDRWFLHAV